MRKSIFGTAATSTPFRNSKASTASSPAPPVATPAKSRWRTIFHTNLFLLGFQPSIHATGTYAAIIFDEQMFSRGANNTKVMEVVAWFLFEKLDAATAQERFVDCWPIVDTRKQPRQFRDVTYKWLEALRREGHLGNDPPLMRSYFEDCRGVRIERTMAAFSSHVLRIVMERDFKQYSKSSSRTCTEIITDVVPDIDIEGMSKNDRAELRDLLQIATTIVNCPVFLLCRQMHIVAQSDEFFAETEYRRQAQERWYERANAITAQFRELQKRNGELEVMKQHLVHEKTRRHQNEPEILTNDDKDVEREERDGKGMETLEELEDIKQRRIEQVRQLWKECIEWMGNEEDSEKGEAQEGTKAMGELHFSPVCFGSMVLSPFAETIEMILHERANNHRVDGRAAKLEIPEWMLKEWDNEFKKVSSEIDFGL
ncbi:HAUS augmin-like complex subunit 6 N-terminus-domain-containing protein [Jimgerdemannia flammicorona]|uniref:HAUS augmin-like complex subunit 6 N-terminus-domain-containing protein n=1 Tax=Jimgerdemannia flammicorona TaxID=994334 RepID=A0A433QCI1_9FUNG|nr:HAUS augmin-like complex subunit 6 N-terminus-domain-containing protein [Jimgerdemannia flammicorona]